MAFQTALSGLNGASGALNAIGNNIANSGTVGFKEAAAQFSDVYAASLAGAGSSQTGIGTNVAAISQQFTQGNISTTNNPLDIAINGQGFFQMQQSSQALSYTRNGQFQVNKDGYVVNAQGDKLTARLPLAGNNGYEFEAKAIKIDTSAVPPVATGASTQATGVQIGLNLDSRQIPPQSPFATNGSVSGGALGASTTIPAAPNNTLQISVDGGAPQTVSITPGPYSIAALVVEVQTKLSAVFPTIQNASGVILKGVSVAPNGAGTGITITSLAKGAGSGVAVTGGTAAATILPTPTLTTGVDGFDVTNPATYNSATSVTVYDSLGNSHVLGMYFVKTALATNTWTIYTNLDGSPTSGPPNSGTVTFNSAGALLGPASAPPTPSFVLNNGATTPLTFPLSLSGSTQYGAIFGVNSVAQDGYTSGSLAGLSVSADGVLQGRYTNGQTRDLAQVVLFKFANPNGLMSLGGNQWQATSASGQSIGNSPNSNGMGALQAAAIEESNVDLTAQLVNMITAQRAYQANAQTIKTEDALMQTLVNLR
jgi:flagellar hook protein FlgE